MPKRNLDTINAAKTCADELKKTLEDLESGKVSTSELVNNIKTAARLLETIFSERTAPTTALEDDIFSETSSADLPESVQEWISTTFTKRASVMKPPRRRLRSLVNAVRVGIMFDKIYRKTSLAVAEENVPPAAQAYLCQEMNKWSFDVFTFDDLCGGHSLKCLAHQLFSRQGFLSKFSISIDVLENFFSRLEDGYSRYGNPYHNLIHAADVTQTCLFIAQESKLDSFLSDLEMFSLLFAALIHDYEHTGTTNTYHVITESDLAIVYNDKSVLENYHVSAVFSILLKDGKSNIISGMSREDYREFRSLVVDMVLATDMSVHFNQLQSIKEAIVVPENLAKVEILSLLLHAADISHPSKSWELHQRWTDKLVEEYFRQGDKEREMGLPCSPLCDRRATLVPQAQIGFINFIVDPCFQVLSDMLGALEPLFETDLCAELRNGCSGDSERVEAGDDEEQKDREDSRAPKSIRPWTSCLKTNKQRWSEMADAANRKITTIAEEDGEIDEEEKKASSD